MLRVCCGASRLAPRPSANPYKNPREVFGGVGPWISLSRLQRQKLKKKIFRWN